jgi:tetratricopeptide (TPR) repeat protein
MRRLLLVLVCFLFTTVGAWAQQVLVDSLVHVLNATENNAARVDVLCELSSVSYNYDIELGYSYAQQAYAKAKRLNYEKGMCYALILQGFYHQDIGENETALKYYREASALYDSPDDLQAYGYVMTGNLYRIMAQYDSASIAYARGLAVQDNIKSETYRAYTYKSMARLYMVQWKNKEAEESLIKALELYKKKNSSRSVADTELLLARLYRNKTEYSKADVYIAKACETANALKDDFLQFQCLGITGEVRADNGDYTEALELYFRALKMLTSKNIPTITGNLYYNIGSVYEERGQNDLALKYFLEALNMKRQEYRVAWRGSTRTS